jgi:hypothetical protein
LASAVLLLLPVATAKAGTVDPLHGYAEIAGVPTNTDNGVVSPIALGTDSVQGFGFFASPAPLTDDNVLVVLEPNTVGNQVPISVTGNVGGGTAFVHVGTFSGGDLATLLGFTPASPANPFAGFVAGDTFAPGTVTSFNVFKADLGTQTEQSLANSTMVDNIIGGIVKGTEITDFSVTPGSTTVSTALSGVLAQSTSVSVPGPIVGAGIPGIIAGCLGLVGLARRRINRMRGAVMASAH